MRRTIYFLVAVLLCFISLPYVQAQVVGSIPGQFNVGSSGAASYTIPIDCPAGINGMQPNISLVYNSQNANGNVGWGWNLNVGSAISRTGSTLYHDGKMAAPLLTTADNLMLDGQRLILISGTNLTEGAKYRTEIETFSDITIKTINGLLCFEVATKNGLTLQFGSTSDSYIEAQGSTAPLNWLLTKAIDPNGNYMTYSYGENNATGEFWVTKINYTGNATAGVSPVNEIDFTYNTARADSRSMYIAGSITMQTRTLASVTVLTNSTTQKTYTLNYTSDGFYTKLASISLIGLNGVKYNPTVINWNKLNNTVSPSFSSEAKTFDIYNVNNNTYLNYDNTMVFVDLNNDGVPEVIKGASYTYQNDKVEVYKSTGSTYTLQQTAAIWQSNIDKRNTDDVINSSYQLIPCDVNNDGIADIITVRGTEYEGGGIIGGIQYWNFNVNVFITTNGQLVQSYQVDFTTTDFMALHFTVGDFNGDGTNEFLSINENGTIDMYRFDVSGGKFTLLSKTKTGKYIDESNLATDVNGNGIPELNCYNNFWEYNSVTNAFATISFTGGSGLFGDINGDGKTDVLQYNSTQKTWSLALSTGKGFTNITCPITRARTYSNATLGILNDYYMLGDYNGDGLIDIAEILPNASPKVINIYYFNGSGFTKGSYPCPSYSSDYGTVPMSVYTNKFTPFIDFNGDGKCELLENDAYGVTAISFSTTETERNVSTITNGLNQKNTMQYKVLSDNTVYAGGSGVDSSPVIKLCMPLKVVASSVFDAGAVSETTNYYYKGLRIHTQGKGLLGFEEFTESNTPQNRKIVSQFGYNSTYFNTYPTQQTVSTLTDQLLSTTTFVNAVNALGGKRIYPYISAQTSTDNLTGLSTTSQIQSLDSYANTLVQTTTKGGMTETKTATYIQKGAWCPNKASRLTTSTTLGSETYSRDMQYTYDDKGNLAKTVLDPSDVNSLTTDYTNFDNFGHPRLVTTSANSIARSASVSYTASGRFVQSQTNVLGQTTTYNWDETRSLLTSQADRLGTTTYTYNGLGTLTESVYPTSIHKTNLIQWATTGNAYGALYYNTTTISGTAPVTVWYDGLQRPVVQEAYGLNGNVSRVFTQYRADRKTDRVSAPTFGTQAATWDAVYDYYTDGRPKTVTTPQGITTSTYAGLTTTVSAPEGTQATTLNAAGQPVTSTVNGKTVTYAYYASGKAKTATPDGSPAVAMEYDLQGNRTKLTDPDAGVSTAGYNGYGELKWEKQTNNAAQGEITTSYNYNATTGQIESRVRNGVTTGYAYDTYKRLNTVEIAGQDKQTYTYGDYDRVTALTELINGTKTLAKGLEYDAYGRVNKETFPSGYYTVNNYDSYGNLNEVTDKSGRSVWKATEANARGQQTRILKGTKETVYGYDDSKGLLTSMAATGVVNYSYSYDAKNNLEYRSDNLLGQKDHFSYDTQNRLTNWDIMNSSNTVLKPNSLTYNATTGNIATKSDLNNLAMNYGEGNGKPHALTTVMGKPDAISASDLNVTYTDFRKIRTLAEADKNYTLTYGVDDQRRMSVQTQGAVSLTRYYLGDYEEETDNLGNVKKIHYLSGGAMLVDLNGVETLYYGYTDNQGSLIALTDASGKVEKYAYDPWGARRNPNDWTQSDSRTSFINNRGYTGHEHLDAFGVINMNGRVYDPLTAQFFSPDPFIQSGSDWKNYNRYSYCMNNPTRNIDPSGYKKELSDDPQPKLMPASSYYYGSRFYHPQTGGSGSYAYRYDWGAKTYTDSQGNFVSTNEVVNNYINPNLGSASEDDVVNLLSSLKSESGFNVYSIKFSSGYTSYAASIGDIGEATMGSNGGLSFSNPTVGMISMSMWGGSETSLSDVNTGLGVFGALNSIGTEIAHDYVSYGFKSANGWQEFGKLASNQQTWRAARILGETGASVLKYAKLAGKAAGLFGAALTAYQSGIDGNFTMGDAAKVGIGLVTTFTPYGWVYGAADFGMQAITGQSITDRIGNFIDN